MSEQPLADQPLADLLTRLERERLEADRRYNDALTAVNHAIQTVPALPPAPPPYDDGRFSDVNAAWTILQGVPPGIDGTWQGRLRGAIWRLVGPPLEAQQRFNALLVDHLNRNAATQRAVPEAAAGVIAALRDALEGLHRFQSLLVQYLMTITAFVDTRDRRLGAEDVAGHLQFVEQRLFAITTELDRWQRTGPPGHASVPASGVAAADNPASGVPVANIPASGVPVTNSPASGAPVTNSPASGLPASRGNDEAFVAPIESMTYVGFEDRFRGTQEEIRARVDAYLPIFQDASDVADIGCGRGELLDGLRERGVRARGVDTNHAMVELCRARGLEVEETDAVSFLANQAPGSLGGLIAIQVVEHFTPAYLSSFLAAAYRALRPGAAIVLETINPACWSAFFETYIRDLTHQRPLHPDTLKFLVQANGFGQVDVQLRQPVRAEDRLDRVSVPDGAEPAAVRALIAAVNAHADKLNARMFTSFDYVIVGRR